MKSEVIAEREASRQWRERIRHQNNALRKIGNVVISGGFSPDPDLKK